MPACNWITDCADTLVCIHSSTTRNYRRNGTPCSKTYAAEDEEVNLYVRILYTLQGVLLFS